MANETPPSGLKNASNVIYVDPVDFGVWLNKGKLYGWNRLASFSEASPVLGTLVNDSFTRATTGFPLTGSNISQSITGGKWQIVNNVGNTTYDNYAYINYTTWLSDFDYTIAINPISDGNGIALGWINAGGAGHAVRLDMNTAANRGTIAIVSIAGGTGTAISTSASNAFTYANTDQIFLRIRRIGYKLLGQVYKAGQTPITVNYDANLSGDVAIGRDNKLAVFSFGGTQQISNINFNSNVRKNPLVATVGDSNAYGFNSGGGTNYDLTFQAQINKYINGGGVLYAASGGKITDFEAVLSEFIKIKPRYALIHLGTNDAIASVTAANYTAALNRILPQLDAAGIIPILCNIIPTSTYPNNTFIENYNSAINNLSPRYRRIDTYTPFVSAGILNTAYSSGDGTHINSVGQELFASTVFATMPTLNRITPSVYKSYTGASSGALEPEININNISPTQGDGTTTFNRAIIRLNSGNGTVRGFFQSGFNSGGTGNSLLFGTSSDHDVILNRNGVERARLTTVGVNLPNTTANRATVTDASKNVISSAVTDVELGRLSGVTSAVQTQLDAKVPNTRTITINGTTQDLSANRTFTITAGGSVTNVSSPNSDIAVANPTTTPVLTLNSGTGANQIVKRNGSGNIPDLASYVPTSRNVFAGVGISGGGNLSADIEINVNQANAFTWTNDHVWNNKTVKVYGTGASADAMGAVNVTMPADGNNYAMMGISRLGATAIGIGMDTGNNLIIGGGAGRNIGAVITNISIMHNITSGATAIYKGSDGTLIFNLSSSGFVTANAFIKAGGTSSQYLMADGSVTTSAGITQTDGTWAVNPDVPSTSVGEYVKTGKAVQAKFTVAVNSGLVSSARFTIGTLPFAYAGLQGAIIIGQTDIGIPITGYTVGGTSIAFKDFSGVDITNTQMSGKTISGTVIYNT